MREIDGGGEGAEEDTTTRSDPTGAGECKHPGIVDQQSFPELASDAVTMAGRGFIPLLACWVIPMLPVVLLGLAASIIVNRGRQVTLVNEVWLSPQRDLGAVEWNVLGVVVLAGMYATAVAFGASLRVAAGLLLEGPVSVRAALVRAAWRCGPLVVAGLVFALLTVLVVVLGVLLATHTGVWFGFGLVVPLGLWCWRVVAYVAVFRVLEGSRARVWHRIRSPKPGFFWAGTILFAGAWVIGALVDWLSPLWLLAEVSGRGMAVLAWVTSLAVVMWWGVLGASLLAMTAAKSKYPPRALGRYGPLDLEAVRAELAPLEGRSSRGTPLAVLALAAVTALLFPGLVWLNPTGAVVVAAEHTLESGGAQERPDIAGALGEAPLPRPDGVGAFAALASAEHEGSAYHAVLHEADDDRSMLLELYVCADSGCDSRDSAKLAEVDEFPATYGERDGDGLAAGRDLGLVVRDDGSAVVALVDSADGSVTVFSCDDAQCSALEQTWAVPPQFIRWEAGGGMLSPPHPNWLSPHMGVRVELRGDGRPVLVYRSFRDGSSVLLDCQDLHCAESEEAELTGPDLDQQTPALALDSAGLPRLATYDRDREAVVLLSCHDKGCKDIDASTIVGKEGGTVSVDLRLDADDRPRILWERGQEESERGLLVCGRPDCR